MSTATNIRDQYAAAQRKGTKTALFAVQIAHEDAVRHYAQRDFTKYVELLMLQHLWDDAQARINYGPLAEERSA